MVKIFNNQDETGLEVGNNLSGIIGQAGKPISKAVSSQMDFSKSIADHLYGKGDQKEEISDNPHEKTNAELKSKTNIRNPVLQHATSSRIDNLKNKSQEDIEKYERLRKLLHDEQVSYIFNPSTHSDERIADKISREEEEKKEIIQEQKFEEHKKKEALAVVQKRTSAENKGFGAG